MLNKTRLNELYRTYNRRKFVHPDPLEFLYRYPDRRDREIAGLIASALAYGRVAQILKSVTRVLAAMGDSPHEFIHHTTPAGIHAVYDGFKHRFTVHSDLVALIAGMRKTILDYGSLNECFVAGLKRTDPTVLGALDAFLGKLDCRGGYLLPLPGRGSACKRMHLYLRWMVRNDAVDPGGWKGISPAQLIIPLDTHMAHIGRTLGLTRRKSADQSMALELTQAFRDISPNDPVKYDFALTRFGIRSDMEMSDLLKSGLV